MISCRKASELATQKLDQPLPMLQNMALKVHVLLCPSCKTFQKQIISIDQQTGEFFQNQQPESVEPLSIEAKERIETNVKSEIAKNN